MQSDNEIYVDKVYARGHRNIRATHRTTFEITREDSLTPRGDCIIAISADKSVRDLDQELKNRIKRGWVIAIAIVVNNIWDMAMGYGDPGLELSDPVKIIARKSTYIAPNTIMLRSNKAAVDLRRDLMDLLKKGEEATIYIAVSNNPSYLKDKISEIVNS
ncbi:MAG TPA: DUF371 domain-containing protein [Sulfolobales archaeon]|nr:DUF371 domain-containing protein [Sulfolobales archaeon]